MNGERQNIIEFLKAKQEYAEEKLKSGAPIICLYRTDGALLATNGADDFSQHTFFAAHVIVGFTGDSNDIREVRQQLHIGLTEFTSLVGAENITQQYIVCVLRDILRGQYTDTEKGIFSVSVVVMNGEKKNETIYVLSPTGDYTCHAHCGVFGVQTTSPIAYLKRAKNLSHARRLIKAFFKKIPGVFEETVIEY